jgi:hypothetical protein
VNIEGTDLLLGGDVILSVNNIDITAPTASESLALGAGDNYDRIFNSVQTLKAGDVLTMKVFRGGKVLMLTTTLEP